MKSVLALLFIIIIHSNQVWTQDFGEISDETLQMKTFGPDPDADAVIIFDKIEMKITDRFNLEAERHKRIKILTEEGKKYADVQIKYWHEDEIDIIDAGSFNVDGSEIELDGDDIFVEEMGNYKKTTFAIPGVEVGSVIDYVYELTSEYISGLEPWYFQDDIYTVLSLCKVNIPQEFKFNSLTKNLELYDIQKNVEEYPNPYDNYRKVYEISYTGKNIPGLKGEKFIDNIYDHYASMFFILDSYKRGLTYIKFAGNWNDVAKRISKRFAKRIEQGGETVRTLNTIVKPGDDDLQKAKKLYDFVRTQIKTTSQNGSYYQDPETLLEKKEGTASSKNVLLINLLNNAGLDAKPVLISTRSHGRVHPGFCNTNQFNRVICLLKIGKKSYYLHTGLNDNPFGYLTPATSVDCGLLIDGENGTIINLKPKKPSNKINIETEVIVDNDEVLAGKSVITYKGHPALMERNKIGNENVKEYVLKKLSDMYDAAELDTFYYTNVDSIDESLVLNIEYSLPDYLETMGEFIFITPPFFSAIKDNPFVSDKRNLPVDFDYPVYETEKIKIIFGSNLKLSEKPSRRKSSINGFSYSTSYSTGDGYVECKRTSNLKSNSIRPQYYTELKNLYDVMVTTDFQQFVFERPGYSKSE